MDAWSYSNVRGYASKVLVEILQVRAMPSKGEHSVSERYGRKNRERPRVLFLAEMSNEGKKTCCENETSGGESRKTPTR